MAVAEGRRQRINPLEGAHTTNSLKTSPLPLYFCNDHNGFKGNQPDSLY